MAKLAITGQGAIGSILATHCEIHNIAYAVQTRHRQTQQIDYRHQASGQQHCFTPNKVTDLSQYDALILPLKAYQIMNCLEALAIPPNLTIVLLHNGMGTIEPIRQLYPHNPLIAAITSYAAFKDEKGIITETGQGTTQLGWIANPQPNIQAWLHGLFSQLLGPCDWQQNIEWALWDKLVINAAINPLTAIHNIPNGELQAEQFLPTISAICNEVVAVMNRLNITQTTSNLVEKVYNVINLTASNYSSMNRDIAEKRPTEIEFINGYIIQQAEKFGVDVPVIKQLRTQVISIQKG